MSRQQFTTRLESAERGAVRLVVPFDPGAVWGRKPRHAVNAAVAGMKFAATIGARGGCFFIPLNKGLRAQLGVGAGDEVKVTMWPAAERPIADVPEELAELLATDPKAREFFKALSPFYRTSYATWVSGAKRVETRRQRAATAFALLREGKKQR